MFAQLNNGHALCIADYARVSTGAIVPPINELWADVQQWLEEGNTFQPAPVPAAAERYAAELSTLEQARKAAEEQGVIVDGVRYSGSQSNRQALFEALQYAALSASDVFAAWKTSGGGYRQNHPVSDVKQALNQIAVRRGALIAKEGEIAARINAGEVVDFTDIDWDA